MKTKIPWNSSDINFRMAPNQFTFSITECIFVSNFTLFFLLEQLGQSLAVSIRTSDSVGVNVMLVLVLVLVLRSDQSVQFCSNNF